MPFPVTNSYEFNNCSKAGKIANADNQRIFHAGNSSVANDHPLILQEKNQTYSILSVPSAHPMQSATPTITSMSPNGLVEKPPANPAAGGCAFYTRRPVTGV